MGAPEHQWQPLLDSPGVEWCELCHTERCRYPRGWAYDVAALSSTQSRWTEPPCGVPCPACLTEVRADGEGCDVCKGAGMVPRAQSDLGPAVAERLFPKDRLHLGREPINTEENADDNAMPF